MANASINAWSFLTGERGQGETSSDGSYRISLMPGTYWVEIQPPEGSGLAGRSVNVKVAEHTALDIVLELGVILSGRVTGPDGTPVAGVDITATNWLENLRAYGNTSIDGTYRITLASGTYMLEIRPPGQSEYLRQTVFDVEITNDTTFDIAFETGVTLSGYITNPEGKPIADVFVGVWGTEDLNQAGRAFTSADGSYSIANLRPDTYRLEIRPPENSEWPGQIITDVKISEDTTLDIELKPGVILSGKITDSEGRPVADIGVSARGSTTGQGGYGQTSSDGVYRIRLMPGTYTLFLWSDGEFLSQTISDVQVEEDTNLDITLKAGGFVLSGGVSDSKGEAMAGDILVTAHRLPTTSLWPFSTQYRTEIEADGSYQLTLEEGRYDVTCGHYIGDDGVFSGRRIPDIEVSKDMALDITLPSLEEAFEVRGIIRAKEGDPMSEVDISAYDENTGSFSTNISYRGGIYLLVLPLGTYDFTLNDHRVAHAFSFVGPQFPEQHIENVIVEENIIKNITVDISGGTAVEEQADLSALPQTFALEQNYPNPFNSGTVIGFALPVRDEVELVIYNLVGQKVATLVQGAREAGAYTVRWDGRDDSERELASGVYLYRLQAGHQVETRKLLLLR